MLKPSLIALAVLTALASTASAAAPAKATGHGDDRGRRRLHVVGLSLAEMGRREQTIAEQ